MIKVAVVGILGRMGRTITRQILNEEDLSLVGATEITGHELVGKPISELFGINASGIRISDKIEIAANDADIIVDFTNPKTTLKNLKYSVENKKSMVIGTTGFDNTQREEMSELACNIPSVISPNMSVGVNILFELSKKVSALVGNSYDIEIVETHHKDKVDAPSGTAIGIGKSVAEGLGVDFEKNAVFERYGNTGAREKGTIGIQTLRGGDVVGEHCVLFLGKGERIELSHKATSRDNFSIGVIRAIRWIVGKNPGIYSMKDVLGL